MADTNDARTVHELPQAVRQQAEQAFQTAHGSPVEYSLPSDRGWLEGYAYALANPQDATPRAAVPLSYRDLCNVIAHTTAGDEPYSVRVARAVIAKFCEVNGITTASPAPSAAPEATEYYVAGPWVTGKHAGFYSVCEVNTGRVLNHFKPSAAPESEAVDAARRQLESQKDEWLSWEAKRKGLEADAARYRWLKSQPITCPTDGPDLALWKDECGESIRGDEADAAIDAAMAAQKGGA